VAKASTPVDRFFDLSVGSDYPGTLRRDDSMAQLRTVVDATGFRYLRFHGIFHDILGTVKKGPDGAITYDWTGIDKLYDDLKARHLRPFVELGFTPDAMKTSEQTIFWWKGNTSHPQLGPWRDLVSAFVRHVQDRYGRDEVRQWYFEVWNEPNLDGFFEKADQAAYFQLYDETARAIKAIDPALRVGGPATAARHGCPNSWPMWMARACRISLPRTPMALMAVSLTKTANRTPSSPLTRGHRGRCAQGCAQIDATKHKGMPLFFTEWSTSYTPRDFVHDSYVSAPYILAKLAAVKGMASGMSYWTFSDLFEEPGPPDASFHGGFGLMNREGVPKPAFSPTNTCMRCKARRCPSPTRTPWRPAMANRSAFWPGTGINRSSRSAIARSIPSCKPARPRRPRPAPGSSGAGPMGDDRAPHRLPPQ
jgi:xylan 1,4-beta-xylosidase